MKDKQTIETIQFDRLPSQGSLDRLITDLDPLQLLPIFLTIFSVISGVRKLVRLLKKLLKQNKTRRLDPKLLLQLVGVIFTILKAIGQLLNFDDRDLEDEE